MSRTPEEVAYLRAVLAASAVAADALSAMEIVAEHLAPEHSAALAAEMDQRHLPPLLRARDGLDAASAPVELAPFDEIFSAAFSNTVSSIELFAGFPQAPPPERIPRILAALHHLGQAQEHFYVVRSLLPPFRDFWSPDQEPPPGQATPTAPLLRVGAGGHHGGFSVYVPEHYDPSRAWPLVVALHGGSGNGRDFLWTWVRNAKARGYLVVAPTAVGSTWSEEDDAGILQILDWLAGRYNVAPRRILLTGLSDGGTFTLVYGLAHPDRYRALAPLCGVFHPENAANGNLARARGVPIYLVHGARDFLFPVAYAHLTRDVLTEAGAALTYRELPELSHAYPRSENDAILSWFEALGDPSS